MAFLKHARADVTQPSWTMDYWGNFVQRARGRVRTASGSPNLVAQASDILKDEFDPEKYLLTHATIVASVDTSDVPGIRTGTVNELGRDINRKWANYRVSPSCDIYINNNHDCWDRPVLLKSYRTFVGAHNFVEHLQIEEQSKGRIIDAAARDIGDSVYVDILIATSRKHASLINDIEAGRMNTMSMGCSVTETQCTKCGHVAADETEMCDHVKYAKGQYEYDANGNKYRIAELCGHHTLDPTGGVTFIEGSWVAVPAFQGAVLRNILAPGTLSKGTHDQVQKVLSEPPREWTQDDGNMAKAARDVGSDREAGLDMGPPGAPPDMGPPGAPADMGAPGAPSGGGEDNPLNDLREEIEKYVINKIKRSIQKEMGTGGTKPSSSAELSVSTNENINHQAASKVAAGTEALVRIARSDVELIDGVARLEQSHGIKVSRDLYRAALRVGSTDEKPSLEKYLVHCAKVLGRKPTTGEAETLVRLGRILSQRKKTRF